MAAVKMRTRLFLAHTVARGRGGQQRLHHGFLQHRRRHGSLRMRPEDVVDLAEITMATATTSSNTITHRPPLTPMVAWWPKDVAASPTTMVVMASFTALSTSGNNGLRSSKVSSARWCLQTPSSRLRHLMAMFHLFFFNPK
jgi:hypothetical protein